MKAEDLRLEELVSFDDGALTLQGRRLVLHDMHAMAQFRRDLVASLGETEARRILTRFGFYWGQNDAAAMKRVFEWDDIKDLIRAGPRLHALQGVARVVVKSLEIGATGAFTMEVEWRDSGEATEHLRDLGTADSPACWMLCGYASGYMSMCLDRDVFFIEQTCRASGDAFCTATGKDLESWGGEIEPYLTYFQIEDIHEKILSLTEELKQTTAKLERRNRRLRELEDPASIGLAAVRSKAYQEILTVARKVARFDSSVILAGETGVGKEVLARYIHQHSDRASNSFVAVDCGSLPATLLESELFGHKAGSFTGAIRDRKGLFEEAESGTIFLDEIGEIEPALQVKLLRVLQERIIRRIGENIERPINARVLAASNKDLGAAVKDGSFRVDLYYRLRVVEIRIPPLRDRPEDILPLARFFIGRLAEKLGLPNLQFDATCLDLLQRYHWPGNVRELENALERAAVLSEDGRIRPEGLPPAVRGLESSPRNGDPFPRPLKVIELDYIHTVLEHTSGNRKEAAKILGIGETTLWRRLTEEKRKKDT
jgi:DNA-binding NtrC family response regulator